MSTDTFQILLVIEVGIIALANLVALFRGR